MGVPNWITAGRIASVPVFVVLSYGHSTAAAVGAFGLFLSASLSDFFDGYLARRWGSVSRVGKWLDPLADKILVAAALVVLIDTRAFPAWAALVIVVREISVQLLRMRMVRGGMDLPASRSAKWKTALQIAMVSWWLLPFDEPTPVHGLLLVAALVATVWSGAQYLVQARAGEVTT
ncbi:MAG: CDP-diacylglycerol--glycerol-3-phosphate 3-phosphatidyltransferase [Actinomycetota bacterium]